MFSLVLKHQLDAAYKKGFIDGIHCFAHMKKGVSYVGTTGKTQKDAIENVEKLWNYEPIKQKEEG